MLEHTFFWSMPASECRIVVGSGITDTIVSSISESKTGLIVVGSGFLESWKTTFDKIEGRLPAVRIAEVEDGEGLKTIDSYSDLIRVMRSCRLDRDSAIAYFGGGTLGDLSGFCASTYLRGVRLLAFPTTLLAMVDSSLGGKNGIDLPDGKNALGTFYNPSTVIMDVDFLKKGIEHQSQGIAEIVKYGLISDPTILDVLLSFKDMQSMVESQETADLIYKCAMIKMDIVSKDPYEISGEREFLNFGHTVGHAIEKASGYRLPHGTAVMRGMQIESKVLSKILGKKDTVSGLVADVSRRYKIPDIEIGKEMHQSLIDAIRFDKKIRSGRISVQAVDKPGSCKNVSLPLEKYLEVLETWLKEN